MKPGKPLLGVILVSAMAWIGVFFLTAPWVIAGRPVARLSVAFAPLAFALAVALLIPSWRGQLAALSDRTVSRAQVFSFVAVIGLVLTLRVVLGEYRALAVNAWDFSVFELPIQRTLSAGLLYSPFDHRSFLGTHASYVLLAFVPLYAIVASHYWLLFAQAAAIALAAAVGSVLFADLLDDTVAGGLLGLAFLLNSYTAKIVQYTFHVEVFFPLGIFLLVYAIRRNRLLPAAGAALFLLSLKEDATLTVAGLVLVALLGRPRRVAIAAVLASLAVAAYIFSADVVMPRVSGLPPGHAWYSAMWSEYGMGPIRAVLGMLTHPLSVLRDLSRSGTRHLFEPLLFLPLAGWPWLVAALPGILVYGVADGGRGALAQFSLYYSAPVLPLLFVASAGGVQRIASAWRAGPSPYKRRGMALALCLVCALDGAGYVIRAPDSRRLDVYPLTSTLREGVRVQGSLLPHSDFGELVAPLTDLTARPGTVLLDLDSNPYPFRRKDLEDYVSQCRQDSSCHIETSEHGLLRITRDRASPDTPLTPALSRRER